MTHTHPHYVRIWFWLLGLVALSLVAGAMPGGRPVAITLIFAVAVIKAALVAANYMHMRFEPRLIFAIALVPVLFVAVLVVALLPDFVFRH